MEQPGKNVNFELRLGWTCKCIGCTRPSYQNECQSCIRDALFWLEDKKKSTGMDNANTIFKKYIFEISKYKSCSNLLTKKEQLKKGFDCLFAVPAMPKFVAV